MRKRIIDKTENNIEINNENNTEIVIDRIKTVCIVVLSIILFIYLVIGINSVTHGGKIGFFSLRFFIMSSDSAESGASTGDLVVARKVSVKRINENDDIVYRRNNVMLLKKVFKVENTNGEVNLFIENDKNLSNEKIENAEVMGKVLFKIKGVGNIASFTQTPIGMLNLILIAICMFIIIKKIMDSKEDEDDCSKKVEVVDKVEQKQQIENEEKTDK